MRLMSCIFQILWVFIFLSGCSMELQDKKNSEKKDESLRPFKIYQSAISSKVIPQDQPHMYQVELSWQAVGDQVRVSKGDEVLGIVPGAQGRFVVNNVRGTEEHYRLEQLNMEGQSLGEQKVSVKIPRDLVFSGVVNLKEDTQLEAGRVFIAQDFLLTTFNKHFLLTAKEIISEGGTIQNFSDQDRAPRITSGRAGGNIQIFAEKARGVLKVVLRGEAGGHGLPGADTQAKHLGHPGCAGTNGYPGGNAGNLSVRFHEGRDLRLVIENFGGLPGSGGRRGSVPLTTPLGQAVHPPCLREAPEGVDGPAGARGQECVQLAEGLEYSCR